MKPTLLVLAAGMGRRYGGLKQLDPVGPSGETMMDYAVYDARRAGFDRVVFVIRTDIAEAFRATIGARYAGRLAVDYAFQDPADLPAGLTVPPEREKPWGTAHAVLAARDVVREPFAVINADDFYGREAYALLHGFLTAQPPDAADYAMVGYRLRQTLSTHGSVARGVAVTDGGRLRSIREMTEIVPTATGAENRDDPAHPVALSGDEIVSLNCWGFTPRAFEQFGGVFEAFLRERGSDPRAECYIPTVIDDLIARGAARVHVLPSSSAWFGVTYRDDKPHVAAAIRRLVDAGEYPAPLWT